MILVRFVPDRLDAKADRHLLARDDIFSNAMKWYDANRDRLRWDDKARRYMLEDK
jgi:hypothetical protein